MIRDLRRPETSRDPKDGIASNPRDHGRDEGCELRQDAVRDFAQPAQVACRLGRTRRTPGFALNLLALRWGVGHRCRG